MLRSGVIGMGLRHIWDDTEGQCTPRDLRRTHFVVSPGASIVASQYVPPRWTMPKSPLGLCKAPFVLLGDRVAVSDHPFARYLAHSSLQSLLQVGTSRDVQTGAVSTALDYLGAGCAQFPSAGYHSAGLLGIVKAGTGSAPSKPIHRQSPRPRRLACYGL